MSNAISTSTLPALVSKLGNFPQVRERLTTFRQSLFKVQFVRSRAVRPDQKTSPALAVNHDGHFFGKALAAAVCALMSFAAMGAWEPEKPVELIVPGLAGTAIDERARLVHDIIVKYNLMQQPLNLVRKPGGAGVEGFKAVKNNKGDAHQLLIVDNNIFSLPLVTAVPFNWKDMTPVAMLTLEQFVLWTYTNKGLWTHTKKDFKSVKEYFEAVKAAGPGKFKMGGTGSGIADQMLTLAVESEASVKFTYVPFKSGAIVADQLAAQNVDSTVSNPAEAIAYWRSGALTALCVFDDERMPYKANVTSMQSWNDIPTCRESGIPVDYQMLYGIFMPPGVSQEQVNYFIEVFRMVVASPEWKSYMESGAFKLTFRTGSTFSDWLTSAEKFHQFQAKRLETNQWLNPDSSAKGIPPFPH